MTAPDFASPEPADDGSNEAEACRWAWRRAQAALTAPERSAFAVWLLADARRRGALLQAEAALHLTLASAPGEAAADLAGARAGRVRRRTLLMGGVAGGVSLAAAAAGVAVLPNLRRGYSTRVGEVRRVGLEDGSVAVLNTASRLSTRLGRTGRRVSLAAGEAWFQVARDAARPFTVEAGRARVRAVGTAFSVHRRDGESEVLVTEGVVEVWSTARAADVMRLAAGGRALTSPDGVSVQPSADTAEVDRQLAWRTGRINLDGETLAQAVAQFNRYSDRRLVVVDPAIAGERLYGEFCTDDPAGFAAAVGQSLATPVEAGPDEIRLGQGRL